GGVDVIVNPGVPIPDEATAVHGITTERARAEGIEPAEAVDQILTCLRGIAALGWPLVIYNATYDWVVLHHEVWRHARRREDTAVRGACGKLLWCSPTQSSGGTRYLKSTRVDSTHVNRTY